MSSSTRSPKGEEHTAGSSSERNAPLLTRVLPGQRDWSGSASMVEPRRRSVRPLGRPLDLSGIREAAARRAIEAWAGFPAEQQPRPLILLDPAARSGAFPDGATKLA